MTDSTSLPPIFVLAGPGMPGQTVAAALGRNPAAWDLPGCNLELAALTDQYLREMSGLRAGQMHGLLRALALLLGGEQTLASVAMARRWLARRMHLSTGAVARELAGLVAPRRMVMPVTAALFDPGARDRLLATFPDAHFVHLQMHPRHQGAALMAQAGGAAALLLGASVRADDASPIPDPQEVWLMAEDGMAAIGDAVPAERMQSLRLEDLLARPDHVLGRLARALGLPDDAVAVARMARPEDSPFAGPGPFGAHLGGDITDVDTLRQAIATRLHPMRVTALTGPVPWHPGSSGFRPEVIASARALGYA